ncbi:MAG: EAL domain-containing protein [Alphaproteobacteria bacterium]|nr:EAL domain-containing protein [Alphaproteobacteria bacterium]
MNGTENGQDAQDNAQEGLPPEKSAAGGFVNPSFGQFFYHMRGSNVQIWKSRISWRITLTVFITIMLVQISVLVFTIQNVERDLLRSLHETARAALVPSLSDTREQLVSPLLKNNADKLLAHTLIEGMTVYSLDYNVIQVYGLPPTLAARGPTQDETTYRSVDGRSYEVIFAPGDLGRPYHIVMRMDSSDVRPAVLKYVHQNIVILLLMSGFVTSVLMLAMGQWLLEPIMVLRQNLLNASLNPEKPDLQRLKHENRDEIGVAVRIANDLIRQNANNLKRLRSQAEDKIHRLAYYDTLTGLPNRTYFIEKLEEQVRTRVMTEDRRLAIMSVDIDHFKDINDTMGHEIGDKLLEAIGKRLVKALPEDALIARASADEFIIMMTLKPDDPDSSTIVEHIFTAMSEPVSIVQERFQVRVSIGVAHCPEDGTEARQVLKSADIALNRAKEEGRDTVRYYSQDFDRAVQQRFQLLRDLRTALDEDQLQLFYHPQFDLKTGALIGAEALLRWWRPDNSREGGSFVSPAEFIPVAEQSGLIVPLGEWVLRTACEANKAWQKEGIPPFRVAVNISGVQFHRADIVGLLAQSLKDTELDPKWLEIEITESVFMENTQVAINLLNEMHALGVEIAVDDFGTGYSSLSYLRRFPIDRIKIDQSFIKNALVNNDDSMITRTIINLGHSLGLKVIAEGVETQDHEDFLKREGCDEVQGFKYTKPIPADKFREFAIAHNRELVKKTGLKVVEGKVAEGPEKA